MLEAANIVKMSSSASSSAANTSKGKVNYMRVNRTKDNETLYFIEEASLLVFIQGNDKDMKLHYVYGEIAGILYTKLGVDLEKRKLFKNVKKLLTFLHSRLDMNSTLPLESMAGLEEILDKIE